MRESQFTAQYERKFSDGNYGSEGLSLSITLTLEGTDDEAHYADNYATDLRRMVLGFLACSSAERVAWAAKHELEGAKSRQAAPAETDGPGLEDLPF